MINSPLSGSTIINSSIISEKANSADDYVNQMSNFNQQQQRQVTSFNSSYNYSSKQGNLLNFCSRNKIDVYSLENRIDYHLSRIMKGHRLINFKNSIERLPIEKRICECIIEILMSTLNLIARKTRIIINAKTAIDSLKKYSADIQQQHEGNLKEFVEKMREIRSISINLEQIVWALNSNKEHIRYIAKVFQIPEQYKRSEFQLDPNSNFQLKQSIINTVHQCHEVINVCRILRRQMQTVVIESYLKHFVNCIE